ncbi:MAG: aspartate aminotransferase family protein [Spirochaetes bacterium]|nr:aspartate aminotransferase family protein [Spirochaetota bacterium]
MKLKISAGIRKLNKRVFELFGSHISKQQIRFLSAGHLDILETERGGIGFVDRTSGRRFIDAFSSAGCFNVGRLNSEVVAGLDEIAKADMGSHRLLSRHKIGFAKKLASLAPGDLNRVMLTGSGADSVECALKLAMGATGRSKVIAMVNAYHGHSGFSLSAGGKDYYKELFKPLKPGFSYVPFGDLNAVRKSASLEIAAIILEPVQGEGGIHVGSDDYLKGLRSICDELGIMLIFDEIQTGFCRTGKFFYGEYSGVVPDIMALAKSISGGVYPNGAVVFRDIDILRSFVDSHPDFHESFGGGSDIGCMVSSRVIDFLVDNRMWENAAQRGKRFQEGLDDLMRSYPKLIREIRGKGLMLGVEYLHEFMGVLMADNLAKEGVFAAYSGNAPHVMRFMVPITVTEEEIDDILAKIGKAVRGMGLYLSLMLPLSRISLFKKIMNNVKVLIFLNNLLRKLHLA